MIHQEVSGQPSPSPEGDSRDLAAETIYRQQVEDAVRRRTGSPDTYLTVEKEQDLARRIQDGRAASEEYEQLHAKSPADEADELLDRIAAGREAEHELIESNLKLARYLARASMGLRQESRSGRKRWGATWANRLKSPRAELSDRIQAANLGLIKAARDYKPGITGKDGRIASFPTYATKVIVTTIGREAGNSENLIRFPAHALRDIAIAFGPEWEKRFSPEDREALLRLAVLQETLPLDALHAEDAAPEEAPGDGHPYDLPYGEVVPDIVADRPLTELLEGSIEEAMTVLTSRQAEVIRLFFGLTEDKRAYTLGEIGEREGVTRERVRQIKAAAVKRLATSPRSRKILENALTVTEADQMGRNAENALRQKIRLGKICLRLDQ